MVGDPRKISILSLRYLDGGSSVANTLEDCERDEIACHLDRLGPTHIVHIPILDQLQTSEL
jgi:hypothetical protein